MKAKTAVLLIFITWEATQLRAQPDNPVIPGGNPTPIDGGLSALLVAGAGYGIKKLREHIN